DLDDETLLAACQKWDNSDSSKQTQGTPLEDLPGFDTSSGHIWIYPTNLPVRDYQFNIVEQSLFKNTLVTLPTGLGKTFIAAVVMYNFYRWYPSGKIVFMAPTKPLVAQQIEACYNIMGIPQNHTAEMTGSMHPPERKQVWQSRRIFFLTPQVLMNDLSRKACPAHLVKCLVVDEAHKALGNHSYCQVVRELSKYTINFRVLALSATPGTDLKAVQQVISNLQISHIEIRSEEAIDIQKYVHSRTIDKYVVPLGDELQAVQDKYIQIISYYVNRLNNVRCLYTKNVKTLTKYQVLMCRDAFRQDPPQNMQRAEQGVAEGNFAILISLYHGYELLLQHGMHSLQCFLTSMVDGSKGLSRAKTELMRSHNFQTLMRDLEMKFSVEKETNAADRSLNCSSSVARKPFVYSHPKLKKLEEVVHLHFDNFKNETENTSNAQMSTRVMIFTQYRDSVHEITDMLNRHKPTIKCMSFVGQSSAGKSTKGFTQKEQLRVVKEFRTGGYNTIVSTCVGEEGLDIGDVDLIVCYDAYKSPIRLVQRMGRTGRKRKGRIVMLVTEGKEEQVYNQSLSNKKGIHKALQNSSKKLDLYRNSRRMVPKGLNPSVHKMYLTVATAFKSKTDKASSSASRQSKIKNNNFPGRKDDSFLNVEELAYWNLHYKLDDHKKNLVKTIPAGGRFLTIGDRTSSQKKPKCVAGEFSLSEWSIWQTKFQPTKLVDHSKRCRHFVEMEEFLEVQGFADGEDVYGMEMATFLNKDDIIRNKRGIQRFCINKQLDGRCSSGEKDNREEDKADNHVPKSKSHWISGDGTNKTNSTEKLVALKDNCDRNFENQEGVSGKQKSKPEILSPVYPPVYSDEVDFQCKYLKEDGRIAVYEGNKDLNEEMAISTQKKMSELEDSPRQANNGICGKRKKKTKHLSPVHSDDDNDDFQCKGVLSKVDFDNGLNNVEENKELVKSSFYSEQVTEESECMQINQSFKGALDANMPDEECEISVVFPKTQVICGERLPAVLDRVTIPPKAPNISSLDFLDDIDDLEQSIQISKSTINYNLDSFNKSLVTFGDLSKKSEQISEKIKVSEGIDTIQINHTNVVCDVKEAVMENESEAIEVVDLDSEWDFDLSDVENEASEKSIEVRKISPYIANDHKLCINKTTEGSNIDVISLEDVMCSTNRQEHHNIKDCISSKTTIKDGVRIIGRSPPTSQGFIPNCSNVDLVNKDHFGLKEVERSGNKQEFDLRFDLNDFLNDDDDENIEDDDEIIPPSPNKFNIKLGRSLLSRRHIKEPATTFIPSNSSAPNHSALHFGQPNVSDATEVRQSLSLDELSIKTHPAQNASPNMVQKGRLSEDNTTILRSTVFNTNKCFEISTSSLDDKKNQVKETETKGIKRKSDPLPAGQKKRKILADRFQLDTPKMQDSKTHINSLHDCNDSEDEIQPKLKKKNVLSTSTFKTPTKQAIISNDSEDEIQPKLKNKRNVLSTPTFKTPTKQAKKSKYVVISSDSEEDKISCDELTIPLKQRLLRKSSETVSTLLNHLSDDDEDFQVAYGVARKPITTKKTRMDSNSKYKRKHRQDKKLAIQDLFELEADVDSDVDCSSDENDNSQVDKSILDFINDNTVCSQAGGGDVQALYLKSLRDSDNQTTNNRYRLAPQRDGDDEMIFSQIPQQDEDYGDDSFVVYEEDNHQKTNKDNMLEMTINPDNIIDTKTRRGIKCIKSKQIPTNKLQTRKRVFMYDSSSEEENIIKYKHLSNSSEHRNSESTQINVSPSVKQPVNNPIQNTAMKAVIRNEVSSCNKTCEQLVREERLKRQKEKQLEFRRKMAEKDQVSENSNFRKSDLKDLSTDKNQITSINRIKSNGKIHDNDDTKMRSNNDKAITSSHQLITSKGKSNVAEGICNLKEQYGLSQKIQRCGVEPIVLVNPGVLSSCPHIASSLELQHNLNSMVHQLTACDFMVSNRMGVIRKSFSDFANGANRNKLIDQVRYACQLFDRPCLIVETDRLKKPEEKRIINRTKYLDRTLSQLIRTHLKLLFTDSIDETASVLADLTYMESRKGFSIQLLEKLTEKQEQIFKLCLSIPFFNFAGAVCLSKNCSTFSELISCTPDKLEKKANISQSRAKELHQFFKHKFNLEMLGDTL
ncbi:Fanconi anemia group M protein-like, partial [Antedon mediterranea]|uniref:Fanconi anemia group M protein-like n=1 Tax=Antedon mediterranea TaxID=105859 RepID=UPI003AF4391E